MTKIKLKKFENYENPWIYLCNITNCTNKTITEITSIISCRDMISGEPILLYNSEETFTINCNLPPNQTHRFEIQAPFFKRFNADRCYLYVSPNLGLRYEDGTVETIKEDECCIDVQLYDKEFFKAILIVGIFMIVMIWLFIALLEG